jgi:murein DD-endopeptidase MepM/ murein hydrolase activator NlpD
MANLLPVIAKQQKSAIIKADKFLNTKTKTAKVSDVKNTETESPKLLEDTLTKIERKVIQIDKLLKDSLFLSKKEGEKKRKGEEQKEFEGREKELEKKKPPKVKGVDLPTPPKMGFIDWIKNFITQTILGFIAVRLIDYLPTLLSVLPTIIKVTDFITDVGGKMLDGLITFIDWGYKAYDATRGFIKKIGGDGLAQNFDKFGGALNGLLDAAIVVGLASLSMGGDGGGAGGRGGRRGFDSTGRRVGKDAQKRYAQRFGKDKFVDRFGRKNLGNLPGGMQRGAVQKGARSAFVGLAGKGGAKAILGFVRPLLKRLPIIGALIDFGLSVALGEDPGRAAFRAIGAGILGTIGTAIGSLAFGFGGIVGGILGSIGGDAIGGALYDAFFGNKKVKPKDKVAKAAGGGKPATRGGKLASGPAKRTIKKKKTPRTLRATPSKLKPGGVIGGEKNIKKLYPESKDKAKMSPFDFLKNTYDTFSKSTGLGALVALAIKPLMGDKPSYADYKNVGVGINNWMNQTVSPTTLAYAGGGEVRMESIVSGEDYSDVIARSVQDSVAPEIDRTIQDLMKQLMLKKEEPEQKEKKPSEGIDGEGGGTGGGLTAGQWGPLLDVIAAGEGGYESVNPSFTIPGLTKMTIADAWSQAQRMGRAKGGSGAMGRYQLLSDPVGRAKSAGLDPYKDLFTPANQDKIAVHIIENIRNGKEWIAGKISDQDFLQGIANEWASMPNYYGKYSYSGQGGAIKADKLKSALAKVKKGGYSQQELAAHPGLESEIKGSIGSFGLMDPTPRSRPGVKGSSGYAADSGLDIIGKTGDPIVAPVSGTLLYAETGHTSWSDDSNPGKPGKQSQHSFLIQLSKPFKYGGKLIKYAYGTHLSSLSNSVANKSGTPIMAGQTIGQMGVANKVPHLHLGLLQNRAQSSESDWLSNTQVKSVLTASRFHGGPVLKTGKLFAHKGEFVIDKDSVDLFGIDFINSINSIENKAQLVARAPSIIEKLKAISGYTDYEMPYGGEPQIIEVPVEVPVPMPMGGGGSSMIAAGGGVNSTNDMFEQTLAQLG